MNMHMPEQGFLKPMHEAGWTEERVELLKKLWADGRSSSEIANELGGGLTRNAVIGKVHRLKLPTKHRVLPAGAKPNVRNPALAKPVTGKGGRKGAPGHKKVFHRPGVPKCPQVAAPRLNDEPGVDVTHLLGLNAHPCRWPVGDATGEHQQFCGREPVEGSPYCAGHAARAYYPREIQ